MSKTIRIAVDAMGSDRGPDAVLEGALRYLCSNSQNGVKLYIVGQKERLAGIWSAFKKARGYAIEFVNAPEVVEMHEPLARGLKKQNSSLAVALAMHKAGEVDAMVSAGNTGVCMAHSIRTLGRLEGVSRPAIASQFPTIRKKDVVVLDVGANVDSSAQYLYQFAVMGSIYSAYLYNLTRPTVGLLSIGEEKVKGNDATLEAYKLLEQSSLNFVGNVEGNDIMSAKCDVVVTDGFIGNILLKFGESIKTYIFTKMNKQVSSNIFSRAGVILLSPFLRRLRNAFDYTRHGGAPLLGVNGVVIIAHGGSSSEAIKNAIRVAVKMVNESINDHIREKLAGHKIYEKA